MTTCMDFAVQVWNLDGMLAGGSPALLRTIKAFPAAGKAPEVEVTGLQVHEAAWPRFSIAIGTSASHIHLLRGELGARPFPANEGTFPTGQLGSS